MLPHLHHSSIFTGLGHRHIIKTLYSTLSTCHKSRNALCCKGWLILALSHIQIHSDASAADVFVQLFYFHLKKFSIANFKVVCCRFVVCGIKTFKMSNFSFCLNVFRLCSVILLSSNEIFHGKSSAADLLYVGIKSLQHYVTIIKNNI